LDHFDRGRCPRKLVIAEERAAALNIVAGNIFILATVIRLIRVFPE
jgi:hypothetical protein